MEESAVTVDRSLLKVLSVATRMDILKELTKGDRTPSDISRILRKSNSTIVEHLDVLCKSDLVKKNEQPGKKWIFYSLTEKGKDILSSRTSPKLFIILAAIVALFITGLLIINPFLPDQVLEENQIGKFSSYQELEDFLEVNIGAQSTSLYRTTQVMDESISNVALASVGTASKAGTSSGASGDYSTTNIQVFGVDEADIVKNDGKYIYSVSRNNVFIVDAYPVGNAEILSKLEFDSNPYGIFINKNKLIVFGQAIQKPVYETKQGVERIMASPIRATQRTSIKVYDISDRSNPVMERDLSIDGNYFESRMIGEYVYVVAKQPVYYREYQPVPLPIILSNEKEIAISATDIHFFNYPDSSYTFTNILALNTQDDNEEISSKTFLMGHSQTMYVSPFNMYIVYTKRANMLDFYDRVINKVIVPAAPGIEDKINKITNSDVSKYQKLQESMKAFQDYLESLNPEKAAKVMKEVEDKMIDIQNEIVKESEKTIIHKISLDESLIKYETTGEVPGSVLNQFSMDEHEGYFRIATTTSGFGGSIGVPRILTAQAVAQPVVPVLPPRASSQNHVNVLDNNLKIVGRLEDLAEGERIYSVRFMGDKAYMVTFKQIDPLFVIDLSRPNNPRVLGFLKIPGVSDYMHPYDDNHIIGIGRDATEEGRIQGLKLSLFDVSDVSNPKEISKYLIGERGTDSEALRDHKAFLFSKSKNLLVIPIRLSEGGRWDVWQGAYVFNLDLNGFALKGKITHDDAIEYDSKSRYDYASAIKRSLYIDNILYTVSNKAIKMNDLTDIIEINKVIIS